MAANDEHNSTNNAKNGTTTSRLRLFVLLGVALLLTLLNISYSGGPMLVPRDGKYNSMLPSSIGLPAPTAAASAAAVVAMDTTYGEPGDLTNRTATDAVCRMGDAGDFRSASGLFCIVTGLEHSGTTAISQLVMGAPNLYGAFETGALMADTPADFARVVPWFGQMSMSHRTSLCYGVAPEDRETMLRAPCFARFYRLLRRFSPLYTGPNARSWVVDKTPAYIYNLTAIMRKTPGVPVIVTQKSLAAQQLSYRKRRIQDGRLERGMAELARAQRTFPRRIHVVNMTAMKVDPDATMARAFAFLGLPWESSAAAMARLVAKGEAIGRQKLWDTTFDPDRVKH